MLLPSIFGNDFFNDFLDFPFDNDRAQRNVQAGLPAFGMMHTDVSETDTQYILLMDLPGFKKEDVKAKLKDGYLTVTAVREDRAEDKGRFIRRERFMGKLSRSFYVGDGMTEKDIQARFEDGTLKLTLPKQLPPKTEEDRWITIDG